MAWTLYTVETARRSDAEAALKDDLVARQSQKLRDATALGGPAGSLYVLIEGSPEGVARADELLGPLGKHLAAQDAEPLYRKFKDEDEAASAGMGLFFTE